MDTLKNKEEIIAWLDRYKVENYTLIEDAQYGFVVDVARSVDLKNKKLSMITIKFNVVGIFIIGAIS